MAGAFARGDPAKVLRIRTQRPNYWTKMICYRRRKCTITVTSRRRLLAPNGPAAVVPTCPLLRASRTSPLPVATSEFDPRQTLRPTLARCALVRTIRRDRLTTLEV